MAAHVPLEALRGRRRRVLEVAFAALDLRDHRLTDDLAKERFLIGEVQVDRSLGQARSLGDVFEASSAEAAFGEHVERGFEDLCGPFFGKTAPTWLNGCGHGRRILIDPWVSKKGGVSG